MIPQRGFYFLLTLVCSLALRGIAADTHDLEAALEKAGDKRPELVEALNAFTGEERRGMVFLIASFRRTASSFPLVWNPSLKYVSAVNVTERYLPADKHSSADEAREGKTRFDREASLHALRQLREFLKASEGLEGVAAESFADVALTAAHAQQAAEMLWAAYAESEKRARAEEMEQRLIVVGDKKMPFFYSVNGKELYRGRATRKISVLARSILERGDPASIFSAEISIPDR